MNQIDQDLKCNYCEKIFDSKPTTLSPCGWTVCSKHVDSDEIKCFICSDKHEILKKDCRLAKNIEIKYLKNELENSLIDLNKKLEDFKVYRNDPLHFINEFFSQLLNKIDLQREKAVQMVNQHFKDMVQTVLDLKKNCETRNFNLDQIKIDDLENKIKDLNEEFKKEQTTLKLFTIIEENSKIVESYKAQLQGFTDDLVNNKKYELTPIAANLKLGELFGNINDITKKTFFITGSNDKTIKLWNLDENKSIKTFEGHTSYIYRLKKLSSKKFASASGDKTVKIWDIDKDTCEKTLEGHTNSVLCLEILSDNRLASGSWDSKIKIWNLNTYILENSLDAHEKGVFCLLYDQVNQNLLSGSEDKTIKFWNLKDNACFKTLKGHDSIVRQIKIFKIRNLISCSDDKTVKIWDIEKEICLKSIDAHADCVWNLDLLLNDNFITCSRDMKIKIWDANKDDCLNKLEGHTNAVQFLKVLNDENLLSCSSDQTVKLWNLNENSCIKNFDEHTSTVYCIEIL